MVMVVVVVVVVVMVKMVVQVMVVVLKVVVIPWIFHHEVVGVSDDAALFLDTSLGANLGHLGGVQVSGVVVGQLDGVRLGVDDHGGGGVGGVGGGGGGGVELLRGRGHFRQLPQLSNGCFKVVQPSDLNRSFTPGFVGVVGGDSVG